MKDLGNLRWTKDIVDKMNDIVKYIQTHQCPTTVFLIYSPNLELKMHGSTRFATNFLMIIQFIKIKPALKQTFVRPEWTTYVKNVS